MKKEGKLKKVDFDEFKFRLFKKFGKNTGGNPVFINSTIEDSNAFFKSKDFLDSSEVYAYHCIYDKENIYKLSSISQKTDFTDRRIETFESVNIFDKDLSWVITLFNQNSI